MKVNDLRIGNWIMFRNSETGLFENDLPIVEVQELLYLEDGTFEAEPIPLTKEWLLKFGFKHYLTDKSEVYRLHGFMATYVTKGKFIGKRFFKFNDTTWRDFGHIQNVHQLQNIYNAIIGKELTIKTK